MARTKRAPQAATKDETAHRALVVQGASTAALTKPERALLAEALRQAEDTRNVIEDSLVDLGRWLLVQVFADDAAAALAGKRDNPVWRELLERAGGPTLRLSKRLLYVGLQIAAHDKRIQDDSWRLLEPGRKELLLPLVDEPALRRAAQHVVTMKLSQRATRDYVRSLRTSAGAVPRERMTAPRFRARLRTFRDGVATSAQQKKLTVTLRSLPPDDQSEVKRELAGLRDWAAKILAALR